MTEQRKQEGDGDLLEIFATPGAFFLVFGFYFALQVAIRTLLGGAANLDEAEQLYLTQDLALGYGPQPPLYTWLQIAVFSVTGTGLFGLALLKNLLLFCSYILAYLSARSITGRHASGVLAAVTLLLIPQIAWESQRDLTHSVLAATLSLATVYSWLKYSSGGKWTWAVAFGVIIGCGVLAKYNYVIWAIALLMAAGSLPDYQNRLFRKELVFAIVIAVLIVAPHLWWVLGNRELATASSGKLGMEASGNWFTVRVAGFGNMLSAATRFLLPLALVYAIILWVRRPCWRGLNVAPAVRLLTRAFVVILVLLTVAIIGFGATGFKDRWFQPLFICVSIAAACGFCDHAGPASARWLQRLALIAMACIAVLIPGRVLFAEWTGREERLNLPYAQLAREIESCVRPGTVLLADSQMLAGNLRLAFPANPVRVVTEQAPAEADWILIWNADERAKPPAVAKTWLKANGYRVELFEAPWNHQPSRTLRLHVLTGAATASPQH